MRPYMPWIFAAALVGCQSDNEPFVEATGGPACPNPGVAGCPCIEGGLCVAGALCEDGLCVPEPGGTTGGAGTTGPKTPPDMGDGSTSGGTGAPEGTCVGRCGDLLGPCACDPVCVEFGDCCPDYEDACPGQCVSNGECLAGQVCSSSTQTCVPATGHTYGVVVTHWADFTDVCWDFGACYSPDPFYTIDYCGQRVFTSSTQFDTAQASWSTEAEITITDDCVFTLTMTDEDISVDDWILTWCMRDDNGQCWAIPGSVLHDGIWTGDWDGAGDGVYELEIRFRAL